MEGDVNIVLKRRIGQRRKMDRESLFKKVRIAEWLAVGMTALGQFLFAAQTVGVDHLYLLSFLALAGGAALTLYIPRKLDSPIFSILAVQVVLYSLAMGTGTHRLYGLIYIVLATKAALLLSTRATIAIVIFMTILHSGGTALAIYAYKNVHHVPLSVLSQHGGLLLFEQQLFFCSATIIAALLGRALLAEQKSRREAEHLQQEVESMAVSVERNRIARDIHDSMGHSLTSLNIQLELTEQLLNNNATGAEMKDSLSTCRTLAKSALTDVRKAVRSMTNEDFSLKEAVQALASTVSQQQNIGIDITVEEQGLSTACRHNFLLIVKECLTNIQKHSGAANVSISVRGDNGKTALLVKDDGHGFDPERISDGFGLEGIRQRVQALGGSLKIESSATGTQVFVEMPT